MKIKKLILTGIICAMAMLAGCSNAEEKIPEYEGYHLLWHDEFSGEELDTSLWTREFRLRGASNSELQEYTLSADNSYIEDGKLVLRAIKEVNENGGISYTSGKVNTQGKADFTYGKIEVRAKVPKGQGLWPAIWLLPTDGALYGKWPTSGEIDMMELLGHDPATVYATVHFGAPHLQPQGVYTLPEGTFADDFHVFSLDWEPEVMRFYVDGNLIFELDEWFCSFNGIDKLDFPAPFNQNFYLQLNLAVGGTWPGNPDETTDFENAKFEIDYVRVYQKDEYAGGVTGSGTEDMD